MAKWFSAKETMAQRCQIREDESKTETAQSCQKEKSTARECQTARRARRRSERIRNAEGYRRRQLKGQWKAVEKMPQKGAAAIPKTEGVVSVAGLITDIATVARIVARIQGDKQAKTKNPKMTDH